MLGYGIAMAEFDTSSNLEATANLYEGLRLFDTFCSTTTQIGKEVAVAGEQITAVQLFDQAVDKMALSKQEALTLWAALEIAVRRVRKAVENAPLDDPGTTPDMTSPSS